jgi:hypothetical protein
VPFAPLAHLQTRRGDKHTDKNDRTIRLRAENIDYKHLGGPELGSTSSLT